MFQKPAPGEFATTGILTVGKVRSSQSFGDIGADMIPILQIDRHFDHVQAHPDDVSPGCAVVPGPGVAFEGVVQVATVQEVIPQVVMATTDRFLISYKDINEMTPLWVLLS